MTISAPSNGKRGRDASMPRLNTRKLSAAAEGALASTLFSRHRRRYRRELTYDPRQDCTAGFAGPSVTVMPVRCDHESFVIPDMETGVASGVLELQVRATTLGKIADPAIAMSAQDFEDIQYLERGVRGIRFLNVSRLLAVAAGGMRVQMRGRNLAWQGQAARLHVCRQELSAEDRVLVIAPHPDDAEIAAFGLYSSSNATVVTLTTGDRSARYQGRERSGIKLRPEIVRRVRVWDSLTVPQLGNVPWEHAINLCYPDGLLQDVHSRPDQDFRFKGADGTDFVSLRRLNRSHLVNHEQPACTWRSLISELCQIIKQTQPAVIVTPHPQLDPHPDHVFATAAVCEAIDAAGISKGRMFFYCAHNRRSELWPFGPKGSGVALLPVLAEDGPCATGFYSHPLSKDQQLAKFLALEAMHDIRQIDGMGGNPLIITLRRLADEFRGAMNGMGAAPKDYLRRAVRPDELFFIISLEDAKSLTRRAVANFKPVW